MYAGVVAGDDVEAGGGGDGFAAVPGQGDLAAAVHRRVEDGKDAGWDEGGVVDEQGPPVGHGGDQEPVLVVEAAVGAGDVGAGEVFDGGVAVSGDGGRVVEGGFDEGGFAGAGWAVEQDRDTGGT